ncbi:MAG: DUF308 domain-containing protein [Bacteroidales bacterium]|nr:DUF308 domain-containing protein [Bacteroidales bacterium]
MSLRIVRSAVLLLSGIAAIAFNQIMTGYSALFGITLSISALITVVHLFINFDKTFNPKVIMELVIDGFAGIIIFTYPHSGELFFLIVFSFWLVFMGALYLSSGLANPKEKDTFPLHLLTGIILIVLGFIIINYSSERMNSVYYLIGFAMIIYASANLYLFLDKKEEV